MQPRPVTRLQHNTMNIAQLNHGAARRDAALDQKESWQRKADWHEVSVGSAQKGQTPCPSANGIKHGSREGGAREAPELLDTKMEERAIRLAIDLLRAKGYAVMRSTGETEMLRPSDLRKRMFLKASAFSLRLAHAGCPPFQSVRGPSGRIRWLQPNDNLLAWLREPLHQGRELGAEGSDGSAASLARKMIEAVNDMEADLRIPSVEASLGFSVAP